MRLTIALTLGALQASLAFLSHTGVPHPHTRRIRPCFHGGTNLEILATSKDDPTTASRRRRFLNWIKNKPRRKSSTASLHEVVQERKPERKFKVETLPDLEEYYADTEQRFRQSDGEIDYDELLKCLVVTGDTQIIGSKDHPERTHPVAQLLHERQRRNSTCYDKRTDGFKVALAVEGGGMRGCVSAGMVAAIYYLGLQDAIDVVYGSSAGTVIGSYFITRQVQWFGPEIYYDSLTTAGNRFIDTKRLLRAVGLGLVDPRLLKDVVYRRKNGKPVLNLDYLLKETVQQTKQLDWDKFVEMQKVQPLKVVASGCKSEKPILMDMESGHFETLDELTRCMHASCLLPGIAGPLMNVKTSPSPDDQSPNFIIENGLEDPAYEPMADALLYEPLPYHGAVDEGATHVIVLRTRADGKDVTGKSSLFERLILKRFFKRKNNLPNMWDRMRKHLHKKLYAEDVIELNEAAWDDRDYRDTSSPHLMTIAMPPGSQEVSRLETDRENILNGVRRGFARAYDALVPDPAERGRGEIVAKEYFPDEILNYDPQDIEVHRQSAFELHLQREGKDPEEWKVAASPVESSR